VSPRVGYEDGKPADGGGRYTKALDQIKVLRKEQNVEIKVDKEKLSSLKIDRDRATRVRSPISSSEPH
jgi:hypothetical protein